MWTCSLCVCALSDIGIIHVLDTDPQTNWYHIKRNSWHCLPLPFNIDTWYQVEQRVTVTVMSVCLSECLSVYSWKTTCNVQLWDFDWRSLTRYMYQYWMVVVHTLETIQYWYLVSPITINTCPRDYSVLISGITHHYQYKPYKLFSIDIWYHHYQYKPYKLFSIDIWYHPSLSIQAL